MQDESIPIVITKRRPDTCSCERPLPRELADWKGAARTVCGRCGLPVPVRWPPPAA